MWLGFRIRGWNTLQPYETFAIQTVHKWLQSIKIIIIIIIIIIFSFAEFFWITNNIIINTALHFVKSAASENMHVTEMKFIVFINYIEYLGPRGMRTGSGEGSSMRNFTVCTRHINIEDWVGRTCSKNEGRYECFQNFNR